MNTQKRVDKLLASMSLEQKILLLSGLGHGPDDDPEPKVPGAAGVTLPLDELGVPSIILADGPAGLRIDPTRDGDDATYYATAFPIATAIASSWNLEVARLLGAAMGRETKEYGADILLAPGMNIQRDPRGGRNFEYYSEDPLLSGRMAAAMINGIQSEGVGATPKHYVANNQETSRFALDTLVSERALREIYLRGFEIAVKESRPWAIMSAYNQVNGTYASAHHALLVQVLREEWGFDGVVMTDWFAAIDDTPAQVRAGNELLMPGTDQGTEQIRKAVAAGDLDEATLDRNLRYLLQTILKTPSYTGYNYSNQPDLAAHAKVARATAAEGVVLLKNADKALPLGSDVRHIAAFGNTCYDFISGGTGSGDVNEAYTVSLVEGLEARGFVLSAGLKQRYTEHLKQEKAKIPPKKAFWEQDRLAPEMALSSELIAGEAAKADLALITLGRTSGEFQDRPLEGDYYLTPAEQELITGVCQAFKSAGKQVVLILNIGGLVEIASWRDHPDAIVLPWQGGQEAGNALVDVLTGDVNPSGKLPMTFPADYYDASTASNFPGVATADEVIKIGGFIDVLPMRVQYEEGIYVGYRYYDAFAVPPAFEFGYGLSYTDFSYGELTLSSSRYESGKKAADGMKASITVTNSGEVAGKEVVQLYLAAPGAHKPIRELKGFAKTKALAPGESQTLEFLLQAKDLASFDTDGAAWVAAAGTYTVSACASSRDTRAEATFTLEQAMVVERTLATLAPAQALNELMPS